LRFAVCRDADTQLIPVCIHCAGGWIVTVAGYRFCYDLPRSGLLRFYPAGLPFTRLPLRVALFRCRFAVWFVPVKLLAHAACLPLLRCLSTFVAFTCRFAVTDVCLRWFYVPRLPFGFAYPHYRFVAGGRSSLHVYCVGLRMLRYHCAFTGFTVTPAILVAVGLPAALGFAVLVSAQRFSHCFYSRTPCPFVTVARLRFWTFTDVPHRLIGFPVLGLLQFCGAVRNRFGFTRFFCLNNARFTVPGFFVAHTTLVGFRSGLRSYCHSAI